ncbi:MAG: gliding motility-associated C-terminal domain-containing protein [Vicingaceae bacterium]
MKLFVNIFLVFLLCFTSLQAGAQSENSFEEGKHYYRLIAVMEDGSRYNSTSNEVHLLGETKMYLPNAFSPDQDGHNDTFGAVGLNATNYKLRIFDRWGKLLFETKDVHQKWDGTYQGKKVSEGVYVYQMTAIEQVSGEEIQKQGTVSLLL